MKEIPCVMTIAGSDSGGGAGIQADLKTFLSNQVFGCSAITCLTAQNPEGVSGILEVSSDILERQILAIIEYFPVQFAKSGMLFSREIIEIVVRLIKSKNIKLVCDPVMIASSGARLLKDDAIEMYKTELLPLSLLFTPNADEASLLLGRKISDIDEMEDACRDLYSIYRVPVLLKGGHLPKNNLLKDILYDGNEFSVFPAEYVKDVSTHGTGCTYSAAITAFLSKGHNLKISVLQAKKYLHSTIQFSVQTGKTSSLNHFITEDTQ